MVLKSLDDALRDGDTIRAVIRGTGTNQDGKTPGIVQPSSEAQASLIRSTYKAAGLDYSKTQYFEAHGTGTPVGDPLELGALGATLGTTKRQAGQPLYVGSVKTNIGHLEGCAGLAGLLKTVLCLENAVIVPSLNYEKPNPRLRLDEWSLKVPTELTPWPTRGVRRASINSFGYGGSNAHCIVDDAYNYLKLRGLHGKTTSVPEATLFYPDSAEDTDSGHGTMTGSPASESIDFFPSPTGRRPRLFVLSSHEQGTLQGLVKLYADHLADKSVKDTLAANEFLANLAFTLGNRRTSFAWRASVVASSINDLATVLGERIKGNRAGKTPKTVFIFTGQGAQWYAMGRELMAYEVFRRTVDEADKHLTALGAEWSVLTELKAREEDSQISLAKFSQPLCVILQIALVNLLAHWGMKPAAVAGHSSGEIAAAYASGALSAEDCFKVAYHRGRLSHAIKNIAPQIKGSMMAVGLSETDVQPYLDKLSSSDTAVVACVNSPSNVTISGDTAALERLEGLLKPANVFARRLKVENAYHSPHMQLIADDYHTSIKDIQILNTKTAPVMFSSVTGLQVASSELDASYWVRNMVSPVQFVKAVGSLVSAPPTGARRRRRDGLAIDTLLEIGPHSALQGPLKQILAANGRSEDTTYLSVLHRGQNAVTTSLEAIGKLWTMGQPLNLLHVNSTEADAKALLSLPDLPGYSWNHSNKFWHETSLSNNHRFAKTPRLDLIGKRVEDFNPLEPRWTNTIRQSEIPWVADHKVQGDILFPAAGMLCAALEAVQQLVDETKTVQSYEYRDIILSRAFVIPPEDKVSMQLHLKPRKIGIKGHEKPWYEFTVYSENNNYEHVEHCSGLIKIHYVSESDRTEEVAEADAEWKSWKEEYAECQLACKKPVKTKDFYEKWFSRGVQYGPLFQPITKIKTNDNGIGCCTIAIQDTKASMPSQFEYDHLLHPVTLDGLFQSFFTGASGSQQAMLPTSIDSIKVSAHLPKGPGAEFQGFTKVQRKGFRNFAGTIVMSDETWNEPKIVVTGIGCTELDLLTEEVTTSKEQTAIRKICSQFVWKEDIDHVRQAEGEQLFVPAEPVSPEYTAACEKAAAIYMRRTVANFTPEQEATLSPHLARYVEWIRGRVEHVHQDEDTQDEAAFLAEIAKSHIDGRLICSIGESLPGILEGSIAPLPIMMQDNMLYDYFASDSSNSMVTKWLDLQGHKRPDYKILEIGAGLGQVTLSALETLGGRFGSTPCFKEYVFSDSDQGCIDDAQKLLKAWQGHIQYKKLDIESEPVAQGFEEGSFEVIIAANTLHGSKNLSVSLSHCYKLLKPGGKLVLTEFTHPLDRISFVLGTLPSWWQSEDGRSGGPLMNEDDWKSALLAAGFSGLDIMIKDTLDAGNHCSSMMVTTKPKVTKFPFTTVVVIDALKTSVETEAMAVNVLKALSDLGLELEQTTLEGAATPGADGKPFVAGKAVVSLIEAEDPLLVDIAKEDFNSMQTVLLQSLGGLWISRGGRQLDPSGDPSFCATTGMLRVVRCEMPHIRMHELNFSTQMRVSSPGAADLVRRVFYSIYDDDEANLETEISELNGHLYIPRLFDEKHKNHSLQTLGEQSMPELQPFSQPGRPLRLDIGNPGMLDTLHFIDDPRPLEPLGDNEVEIEVLANAMNFVDIMVSMGLVVDTVLGADAAGTIKRVGSKVTLVKPGDRVATMYLGAYCNLLRTQETLVQLLPDDMTVEEGATLPCVYITAYQSLVEIGRLSEGETILIHSAAGGLGQAAIMLAKHIGAEIFVTAGSAEKRHLLMNEYGIPDDHIFNSRDVTFAKGIMRMTNGKGVDVVLNSLAGEALRKTWECTSSYGRFIEVGKKDILANSGLEMAPFLRNVTFGGVNIEHMARNNIKMMAKVFKNVFDLIRAGAVGIVKPITVYKYSEIEKAFRLMQQAKHMGKIVLKANPDDMVPVIPRNPHPLKLDGKATYVLVGGTGGIGRALAVFLMDHGAKHLAFMSRSGDTGAGVKEAINELKNMGVNILPYACDVTDAAAVKATFSKMSAQMPRVKGIIQAAMVLNDKYFEDMTYDSWIATTRPKIQGSWNLHELAPKDLDFFLMLSSISGISGNGSQSNYAAGNTYQDGLAHYRKSLGLAACALDLGAISGVGWMAENMNIAPEMQADFARMSVQPHELFSLIESALTGYSEQDFPFPTQMVTGAGTGGMGQQMEHLKTTNVYDDPKYHYLRRLDVKGVAQANEDTTSELKGALTAATSLAHAAELVEGGLALKLSKSLAIAVEDIDTHKAVYSYGVDSLVAIEIRNWIFKELKSQVSVFDILSKVPISQLALKIAGKSAYVPWELVGKEGGAGGAPEVEGK
ncbi:hypothetical protein MMC11_006596 [Xylographa trunciseda]|nr:hypothetical protein [Xylographa trunciseda]